MEENILFKSHLLLDLPTNREFNRGYANSSAVYIISRVITILCTLFLCSMMDSLIAVVGFLVVLILWGVITLIQWLTTRGGGIHYKRMLTANFGKPQEQNFHFTETAILPVSGDQNLPGGILYNQVKRVFETKNLLALVLPYRQIVLVSKANLEGGTQAEFLDFLRRKCIGWKRGKVSKGTTVRVLNWIWAGTIVLTAIVAVCNFPGIELPARINGSVINAMDYEEVAEKLEPLGFTGFEDSMYEELEMYYGQYYTGLDYQYYHKSADMLVWLGAGEYDDLTGEWTPSANGVYAPEYEPYDPASMYTDFLRGIGAMNPGELEITDITEDISRMNQEEWEGTILLSFTLDGQAHDLELYSPGPWLDCSALMEIAKVVNDLEDGKKLYFADDVGSGLLVFYRDEAWAAEFTRITQMNLYTNPNMVFWGDLA